MLIEVNRTEEEGKKEYKVTPKVSVQENKAVTVDVGEYTEPVEILPPEGKVAMEKVTLTLDNIPSGGSATAYAWEFVPLDGEGIKTRYFPMATAPVDKADYLVKCSHNGICLSQDGKFRIDTYAENNDGYTRVSDNSFTVSYEEGGETATVTFVRNDNDDFTLWD